MGAYLILCTRVMLGIVLLVSVATRVRGRREFAEFARWLAGLSLIPRRAASTTAAAMTGAEATAIALLAFPGTITAGLALTAGIIAVFAAATSLITRRGGSAPCRCFGGSRRPVGYLHVARNGALALIAFAAAVAAAAQPASRSGLTGPNVVLGVVLGAVAALATIRLEDIVGLFTQSSQ